MNERGSARSLQCYQEDLCPETWKALFRHELFAVGQLQEMSETELQTDRTLERCRCLATLGWSPSMVWNGHYPQVVDPKPAERHLLVLVSHELYCRI